jgi:hypothetical protein
MTVSLAPLPLADPLSLPDLARSLQHEYFVWDAYVAGKRRVDVHPLFLSEAAHEEAEHVALRAVELVSRAPSSDGERRLFKLHPDIERLAAAARSAGDLGSLARVDLLLREDGHFVACEVNADCPGGHNETVALPKLARSAGLRRGFDPTNVAPRLADRLVALSGGPGSPRGAIALVYATAWAEDLQVVAFLERLLRERGGRPVRAPISAISGEPLAVRGERIAVLYRFYPLEWLAGMPNVEHLVRATERGELASMSSFASIHAQSKLAMARAFVHDPEAARAVFPETIAFADADPAALARDRGDWVVKRDLSRVGDHVVVGALATDDEMRAAVEEVQELERDGDVWIAQRFIPQRPIETPWGPRLVTLGAYVLDGSFAGYFARITRTSHCSHDALVLPVFVG